MNTDRLRIELRREQQDRIKDAFGISSLELNTREIEQRIAPTSMVLEVIKNFGQALQTAARG